MITFPVSHPNSRNVEAFLNSWIEPFECIDVPSHPYTFHSLTSHTQAEIIFFDSQDEGFAYGTQHFGTATDQLRWGMNGGFLYAVSGSDRDLVASLAGHFAGRE